MDGKETVLLTFREHWTCHHLLMKMVTGKNKSKMYRAFHQWYSNKTHQRIINSKNV